MGEIREGRRIRKVLLQVGCEHKKDEKMFPFLMLRGVPTGSRTQYSAILVHLASKFFRDIGNTYQTTWCHNPEDQK
jgi:hypothetical protein